MQTAADHVIQVALEQGLLSHEHLERARNGLAGQPGVSGRSLTVVDALVAAGTIDAEELARALATNFGYPYVRLASRAIPRQIVDAIPRSFALEHAVMPFDRENGFLRVAISDPIAVDVIDSLGFVTGEVIQPAMAAADDIRQTVRRCYGGENEEVDLLLAAESSGGATQSSEVPGVADLDTPEGQASASDAPIINLVQALIAEGIRRRASDVHLEPMERRFRVRYRIDGVLMEAEGPSKHLQGAVISRIKIMANISIAEKRLPQDGRIQVAVEGRKLDLRVSTLPTVHGESIVMRVLDKEGLKLGMPELGFLPDDQREFERLIASPDGILLVTGPTGSGKTTTLYTCLHHLNQPSRKIITVEDPVEYQISGINQVPVNAASGMGFPGALRAMLRQAPNVVMVGEIRDRETAEIAINASLTGHMVFSTLHTNDAPSAVTRLVDIGTKPFLVAAALRASVAQRLVRRNCPRCLCAYTPSVRERHALGLRPDHLEGATFAHGAGCAACQGTGYHGRLGIFEIFLVDDGIRAMIYDNVTAARLRQQARGDGMRTMREDGIRKVLAGLTTIDEVVSAAADDHTPEAFNPTTV